MTTARGLRNFNPGNIRSVAGLFWQGQTGVDDAGFCIFDTPENGLRALCRLLVNYHQKHGLDTVREIINRWAPPVENNTSAYVTAVANAIGMGPDAQLNMADTVTLMGLCAAIVRHENGEQPYPAQLIRAAASDALGLGVVDPTPAPPAPTPPSEPVVAKPLERLPAEELTDIPAAEVDALIRSFKAEGAKMVTRSRQANGLYTVRAVFKEE